MISTPVLPPIGELAIIEACDRLFDFRAWAPDKIDHLGWLNNFKDRDRQLAAFLLSRFMFFSDHMVDQLFVSSFQALSNSICSEDIDFSKSKRTWRRFCESIIVTFVQGEDPNPSDSGYLFARKARQALQIDQTSLKSPEHTLRAIVGGFNGPIVFVDDFVGSGEQFVTTWRRQYRTGLSTAVSFASLVGSGCQNQFFYCNAMMTKGGQRRIATAAASVTLSSGNLIPEQHSAVAKDTVIWPPHLVGEGIEFIRRVSHRLGYDDDDGGENDWRGFHKLGLTLAFGHSIPDASLPIFHTSRNHWTPLVRRT